MIFAELLAMLALVGGGALTIAGYTDWSTKSRRRNDQMQSDLRSALSSGDHRKLDDWLVLYADCASREMKAHVKQRRDDLYIASDR